MTNHSTEHRNAAVLKVLREATGPLTPTQISEQIKETWSQPYGSAHSAPVSTVLKRIGAVKVGRGKWLKPQE